MQKRVYIIHGWGASPDSNWFPWMERQLEEAGFQVIVLDMPNADEPQMEEWLAHMCREIGKVDENVFLVGHSLGTIAILRFVERLPIGKKIGGIMLVSGFSRPLGIPELESFFATPLDYARVKASAGKMVFVASDNDRLVPLGEAKFMEEKLGGKLVVIHGGNHLNEGDGDFTFLTALTELRVIMGTESFLKTG